MTCSSDAGATEGAPHTQYCVLSALMTRVPSKKCTHWMQLHRYKLIQTYSFSHNNGAANCKNIKCLYFCRNTPLDLHQTPSFSKENKWNKVGKRYLLLMEVERWQHLSVDNSSRQLFWGLWYLLSARKLTWLWCNWGKLGNMDQGNWTLWNQFCKGSAICWLVFLNSYIQLAAKPWDFS